ncbi:MAG: hypothetical protein AB8B85_09170, partial [Paracoccaceae bacterium]
TLPELHYISAGLFFGMLSVLCGVFFIVSLDTAQVREKITLQQKRRRNWVYTIMTMTMLGAVALIAWDGTAENPLGFEFDSISFVFWLEAIAVWAFAIAWLLKGEFFTWITGTRVIGVNTD